MIYGYPGDGIDGLIGAIERAEGRIRFRNFPPSIMHGDPRRWRMVQQAAKQIWAGMAAR